MGIDLNKWTLKDEVFSCISKWCSLICSIPEEDCSTDANDLLNDIIEEMEDFMEEL